jgi:hypothetical protein
MGSALRLALVCKLHFPWNFLKMGSEVCPAGSYVIRHASLTFYVLRLCTTVRQLDIRARNSVSFIYTVLDGELAMPCNPRLASAGLNSLSRYGIVGLRLLSSVDDRVLRGGSL